MLYDGFFGPGAKVTVFMWDPMENKPLKWDGILLNRSNVAVTLLDKEKKEFTDLPIAPIVGFQLMDDPPQIAPGDTVDIKLLVPIDGIQLLQGVPVIDKSDGSITIQFQNSFYEIRMAHVAWIRK